MDHGPLHRWKWLDYLLYSTKIRLDQNIAHAIRHHVAGLQWHVELI